MGVAKISLNSGSKTNTEGKILTDDTLAAAPYTYYSCKNVMSTQLLLGKRTKKKALNGMKMTKMQLQLGI